MPRRPRIQLDGVPLHIVQRGHNREPCFFGEENYQSYLHWLGEALAANHQKSCRLHAFVNLQRNMKNAVAIPAGQPPRRGLVQRGAKGVRAFAQSRLGVALSISELNLADFF